MYRHLAFYTPEALRASFAKLAAAKHAPFEKVLLQTASQVCAGERWNILKRALLSKELDADTKIAAFSAVEQLGGRQSKLLSEMVISSRPSIELKERAERLLKRPVMKTSRTYNPEKDRCENHL